MLALRLLLERLRARLVRLEDVRRGGRVEAARDRERDRRVADDDRLRDDRGDGEGDDGEKAGEHGGEGAISEMLSRAWGSLGGLRGPSYMAMGLGRRGVHFRSISREEAISIARRAQAAGQGGARVYHYGDAAGRGHEERSPAVLRGPRAVGSTRRWGGLPQT